MFLYFVLTNSFYDDIIFLKGGENDFDYWRKNTVYKERS